MCYWYYLTGSPIFYSYAGGSGTFNALTHPKFYNIFFHLCNGFLVYSPIMAFTLVGMVWIAWKNKLNGKPILALFVIIAYLCASWEFWWFGGAYGYRSFIDFYPLMALGLAYYLQRLLQGKRWFLYLNLLIMSFFILLNLRMDSIRFYAQVDSDAHNADLYWTALKKSLWIIP